MVKVEQGKGGKKIAIRFCPERLLVRVALRIGKRYRPRRCIFSLTSQGRSDFEPRGSPEHIYNLAEEKAQSLRRVMEFIALRAIASPRHLLEGGCGSCAQLRL